jgi:hypothetical protein
MAEAAWRVLDLLLASERPRPMAELVSEIGSPVAVADALNTLQASSLVERMGALVFITRAPRERTP